MMRTKISSLLLLLLSLGCCQARLQSNNRSSGGETGTLDYYDDDNGISINDSPQINIRPRELLAMIEIETVGNNGKPTSVYPLKECQGDCDDDEECGEGLICMERDANQEVPGCAGGESMSARTDYCIRDPKPSVPPSNSPTVSKEPTQSPTYSASPTRKPSMIPTQRPTTNEPTPTVIPAIGPFQLKLHWTRRSCWTGSGNEIPNCKEEVTKWCMQCEGRQCNEGDILWVEPCRKDAPTQQLFQWLPLSLSAGMETAVVASRQAEPEQHEWPREWGHIQVLDQEASGLTDSWLCLQRRLGTQNHTLEQCDDNLEEQWYRGFDADSPFELEATTPEKQLSNCLTMPHHPRQYEEIIHASCSQSRKDRTSQWKVLWPDWDEIARDKYSFNERKYYRLGAERRSPRCSEDRRCGMCQGHCESDKECQHNLKCFKRGRNNRVETPPGCYGDGVPNMDYCYAKRGN